MPEASSPDQAEGGVQKIERTHRSPRLLPEDFGKDAPLEEGPEKFIEWLGTKIIPLAKEKNSLEPHVLFKYIMWRDCVRQFGKEKEIDNSYELGIAQGLRWALEDLGLGADAALLDDLYEESCILTGVAKPVPIKLPHPQSRIPPPGK